MKDVYAFDVDGTLTAPRQRINQDFEHFLRQILWKAAKVSLHARVLNCGKTAELCTAKPIIFPKN